MWKGINNLEPWLVLKRPSVAGFGAPVDILAGLLASSDVLEQAPIPTNPFAKGQAEDFLKTVQKARPVLQGLLDTLKSEAVL